MQVPLANNPNALFTLVNAPLAQAASETLIEVACSSGMPPILLPR